MKQRKGLHKKLVFDGARRWLPFGHPLRREQHGDYDFVSQELRAQPPLRTTESVREACALVEEAQLPHYKGQYGAPMFCTLPQFNYQSQNICDIAHMLSNCCKTIVKIQVGHGKRGAYQNWTARNDRIHRAECELNNVMPEVWLHNGNNVQLPWRLTPGELDVVDN